MKSTFLLTAAFSFIFTLAGCNNSNAKPIAEINANKIATELQLLKQIFRLLYYWTPQTVWTV